VFLADGGSGIGLTAFYEVSSVLFGLVACLVAYLSYRHSAGTASQEASQARAREIARSVVTGITDGLSARLTEVEVSIKEQHETLTRIDTQGSAGLGLVAARVAVLETKIDVFWRSVAMDAAKIIHSPDPRRAHIDALLESFMDGQMTSLQENELRGILAVMRDYEPSGSELTFPVYPGEQIAAAILLRTMDHAVPKGRRR
jgi:hypothetical protein